MMRDGTWCLHTHYMIIIIIFPFKCVLECYSRGILSNGCRDNGLYIYALLHTCNNIYMCVCIRFWSTSAFQILNGFALEEVKCRGKMTGIETVAWRERLLRCGIHIIILLMVFYIYIMYSFEYIEVYIYI